MRVVARQIVGFDPETDVDILAYPIPSTKWEDVLAVVPHNENDPGCVYNYDLTSNVAAHVLNMIGKHKIGSLNYSLKCERRP